jgi:hypothetical protein
LLLIPMAERGIRIHDAYQLNIVLVRKLLEETGDVAVFKAYDRDPYRLLSNSAATAKEHQEKTNKPQIPLRGT